MGIFFGKSSSLLSFKVLYLKEFTYFISNLFDLKNLIFVYLRPSGVWAQTTKTSAIGELVIQFLEPFKM